MYIPYKDTMSIPYKDTMSIPYKDMCPPCARYLQAHFQLEARHQQHTKAQQDLIANETNLSRRLDEIELRVAAWTQTTTFPSRDDTEQVLKQLGESKAESFEREALLELLATELAQLRKDVEDFKAVEVGCDRVGWATGYC
jgi:hypothetical protein